MKYRIFIYIMTVSIASLEAQSISINDTGADPDNTAMLDVSSTTSGLLIPRMTAAQRLGIGSPADGLMVFQTNGSIGFYVYLTGIAAWTRVTTESNLDLPAVLALGKDAINDSIYGLGAAGIGTTSPLTPLHVEASQTNNTFNGNGLYVVNSATVGATQHAFITARTQQTGGSPYVSLDINNQVGYSIGVSQTNSTLDFYPLADGTGTPIMSMDQNNRVGIGTVAPSEDIHLSRTGSAIFLLEADSDNITETDNPAIILEQDGGAVAGRLGFEGTAGNILTNSLANAMYLGTTTSSALQLATNNAIRMTITNVGDVGIGLTNPARNFHIHDASTTSLMAFSTTASGIGTNNGTHFGLVDALGAVIMNNDNTNIQFGTNGTYRMFLDSNGDLGVGESTPDARLHTSGTANVNAIMESSSTVGTWLAMRNSTTGGQYHQIISTGSGNGEGAGKMLFGRGASAGSTSITMTLSNNFVGIGQTSPTVRLQVDGGSDAALSGGGYIMTNIATGTNVIIDDNEIMARNNGAESDLFVQNDGGDFHIHNAQAGGTQFIIEDDGSVGIRTSAPAADLEIAQSTATTAGTGGARFSTGGSFWKIFHSGVHFSFVDDGTRVAYVEGSTGNYVQPSDSALKENIQDVGSMIEGVMKLRPVSYSYRGFGQNARRTTGFLAQEVANQLPNLVKRGENGEMGLVYSEFSVIAIKAIQEQQKMIEELQKKIEELEARLNE